MPMIRKEIAMRYSERGAGTPRFQNYLTKGFFSGLFRETPSETVTEYSFRPSLLQRKSIIQALKQKSRRGGGDLLYEI